MSSFLSLVSAIRLQLLVILYCFVSAVAPDCVSYGIDFQDGGSYFINSLSMDNFTIVSQFEGCQVDVASVILIDPMGDEFLCTDVPLTPDDTNQLSTCPELKDQMYSGLWSIVIASNNGNSTPIAYQREVNLRVAPQQTVTITPTATFIITTTPTTATTLFSTLSYTTTLPPSTIIVPSATTDLTKTYTPRPRTITSAYTVTVTSSTRVRHNPSLMTVFATEACTLPPPKAPWGDPLCRITPTKVWAAAMYQPTHHRQRRTPDKPREPVLDNGRQRRAENEQMGGDAHIARLNKRAPDQMTITVTAVNRTVDTTITSIAPASTITDIDFITTTATVTPPPITVHNGTAATTCRTINLPQQISTKATSTTITVLATEQVTATCTVTVTRNMPAASASACKREGGHYNVLWYQGDGQQPYGYNGSHSHHGPHGQNSSNPYHGPHGSNEFSAGRDGWWSRGGPAKA